MCVCRMCTSVLRDQKAALASLKLDLWRIMSCLMCVQETDCGCSGRANRKALLANEHRSGPNKCVL